MFPWAPMLNQFISLSFFSSWDTERWSFFFAWGIISKWQSQSQLWISKVHALFTKSHYISFLSLLRDKEGRIFPFNILEEYLSVPSTSINRTSYFLLSLAIYSLLNFRSYFLKLKIEIKITHNFIIQIKHRPLSLYIFFKDSILCKCNKILGFCFQTLWYPKFLKVALFDVPWKMLFCNYITFQGT